MSSRARPASARTTSSRPANRLAALATAALAAIAVGACGSEEAPPAAAGASGEEVIDISGTDPVGEVTAGSVARLATCRDWNGANPAQKLATIEDVRNQSNPNDPGIEAPELSDEEALTAFDAACKPPWAQGFRLYKLYARAVSFVPLQRELAD